MSRLITGLILFVISAGANAIQDVVNTPHNLAGTATGGEDNLETCVYCHTPHGSDSTAAVPLWNRKLGDGGQITDVYDSTFSATIDGTVDLGTTTGSGYSLVCLSCHDGTQGVDVVINIPGTDGYNAAGAPMDGIATTMTAGVALLGTNLQNDHPVGIPYAGGGVNFGANAAAGSGTDTAFKAVTGTVTKSFTTLSELPLYKGNEGTPLAYVECASCHDPHEWTNPTFLRVPNTDSAICTACHVK